MKFELKIIADSKEELLALLVGNEPRVKEVSQVEPPQVKEAPKKAEEPKPEPKKEAPKKAEPKAEEPLPHYTLESVQKAFGDLAKAGMKSDLKELLSRHGVKKVSELPPEEYGNIMDELEELLKGA